MATNTVEYLVDGRSKISGGHDAYIFSDGYWGVSCKSDDVNEQVTTTSEFTFPYALGKTTTITSITLRDVEIKTPSASVQYGHSISLVLDGQSYDFNSNGQLRDNSVVSSINSYKAQHGEFPPVVLRLTSWVGRPPANSDGSVQTASYYVKIPYATVLYTIQGGSFILRPSEDILLEHEVVPSTIVSGYLAINENTADDNATYLKTQGGHDYDVEHHSSFYLSGNIPMDGKMRILAIMSVSRADLVSTTQASSSFKTVISFGDVYTTANSDSNSWLADVDGYTTYECVCTSELKDAINTAISTNGISELQKLILDVYSIAGANVNNEKGTYTSASISQVYLELIYEDVLDIGVHKKVNDEWQTATSAYQKRSGAWVEISETECKSILQNSFIISN